MTQSSVSMNMGEELMFEHRYFANRVEMSRLKH